MKYDDSWMEEISQQKISVELTIKEVVRLTEIALYLKMLFPKDKSLYRDMGSIYRIMGKFFTAADLNLLLEYIKDGVEKDIEALKEK